MCISGRVRYGLFSSFDCDLVLKCTPLPWKSASEEPARTYLNDGPVGQPEEAPVQLPGAAQVDGVDAELNSDAASAAAGGARGLVLGLEVAAGATRLAGVVLPDVIRHCHLVKHSPPRPPDTHTHTGPPPPTKGTYLINFWQELNRFKMILQ